MSKSDISQEVAKHDAIEVETTKNNNAKGVNAVLAQALQSYERLPMLEIVFEKFTQHLASAFQHLTSEVVTVKLVKIDSLRFGEYLKNMTAPRPIAVFRAIEWENLGLIVFDEGLIYTFVEILFGGKKILGGNNKRNYSKSLTSIEHSLAIQVAEVVLEEMSVAFEPVTSTTFSFERLESNPNFVAITRPGDAIITLNFRVEIESRVAEMAIVIPYKTLEPVKEQLQQVFLGDKFGHDNVWEEQMFNALHKVDIALEAVITDESVVSKIANLKIGDTLVINHASDQDIIVRTDGLSLFTGTIGQTERNQLAVSITGIIEK